MHLGTMDSRLMWKITGAAARRGEAGDASRTLLYDIARLTWHEDTVKVFGVPAPVLPRVLASDGGFGTVVDLPYVPAGTPSSPSWADYHAALCRTTQQPPVGALRPTPGGVRRSP